jgi:hypothetical protein
MRLVLELAIEFEFDYRWMSPVSVIELGLAQRETRRTRIKVTIVIDSISQRKALRRR